MKRGLVVLLLLLLPTMALADGGVYAHKTALATNVTIPDQRALICWSNGIERLAIETRFTGAGTNFAWVVPLPVKPLIEEATTGLFTTLDYIFRPNLVHAPPPVYVILLVIAGLIFLCVSVRRHTPPQISDTVVSMAIALVLLPISSCAGVVLFILLPYAVWRVRVGREGFWSVLAALFLVLLFSSMLLPSLSTARSTSSSGQISILDRKIVGAYDTTTVSAEDPAALLDWFHNHGYVLPPEASEVVSNYVKRGWVFVATRLHRDSSNDTFGTPHPLSFTFPTEMPIYPMQLTGIGNSNLNVELFVFGPARAKALNFRTERCAEPVFEKSTSSRTPPQYLFTAHPLIQKWAAGSQVATKLSASLTSEMMTRDIELNWVPFAAKQRNVYSKQGALIHALNYGASLFIGCLLIASIATALHRDWEPHLTTVTKFAALGSFVIATIIFTAVPKVEVRLVYLPRIRAVHNLRAIGHEYSAASITNSISLAESRALLEEIKSQNARLFEQNLLLGGPIREEDSPGNYVLRHFAHGVDFIWFDADGSEHTFEK